MEADERGRRRRSLQIDDADRMHPWVAAVLAGPLLIVMGLAIWVSDGDATLFACGLAATVVFGGLAKFMASSFELQPLLWVVTAEGNLWGHTGSDAQVLFTRDGLMLLSNGEHGTVARAVSAVQRVSVRHASMMSRSTRGVRGDAYVTFHVQPDAQGSSPVVRARGCADWRVELLINEALDELGPELTLTHPRLLEEIFGHLAPAIPWFWRVAAALATARRAPTTSFFRKEINAVAQHAC